MKTTLYLMSIKEGQKPREVMNFPWAATAPCPWPSGYARVLIPFNEEERRFSNGKTSHVQIVRVSRLHQYANESKIKLH